MLVTYRRACGRGGVETVPPSHAHHQTCPLGGPCTSRHIASQRSDTFKGSIVQCTKYHDYNTVYSYCIFYSTSSLSYRSFSLPSFIHSHSFFICISLSFSLSLTSVVSLSLLLSLSLSDNIVKVLFIFAVYSLKDSCIRFFRKHLPKEKLDTLDLPGSLLQEMKERYDTPAIASGLRSSARVQDN